MHLLDTDTLRFLHNDRPGVVQAIRSLPVEEVVGTTIVTKVEVLRGRLDFIVKAGSAAEFRRARELLAESEELLARLTVVPVDAAALAELDRLRGVKGLKKIGRNDLLIASIVLARRATLVTRNLRHFQRIPNLRVVNWVD